MGKVGETTVKKFIVDTLLPYYEDPSTTGYSESIDICSYLDEKGNKCALGKHMRKGDWQHELASASTIFGKYDKKEILTDEAYQMGLHDEDWTAIQNIHDTVARVFRGKYIHDPVKTHNDMMGSVEYLEETYCIELDELKLTFEQFMEINPKNVKKPKA